MDMVSSEGKVLFCRASQASANCSLVLFDPSIIYVYADYLWRERDIKNVYDHIAGVENHHCR
jgi:hypothetical protein